MVRKDGCGIIPHLYFRCITPNNLTIPQNYVILYLSARGQKGIDIMKAVWVYHEFVSGEIDVYLRRSLAVDAAKKVAAKLKYLGLGSWEEGQDYEIKEKLVLDYVD